MPAARPPLLLITGLGGRASFWKAQVPALSASFEPIAYDQRGLGDGPPLEGPVSVESLAHDAIDLLDRKGIGRCHVVGHSTGGAIAQVIAARHPERVDRLVLSHTWCEATTPFRALFELRRELLANLGPATYARHGALTSWPEDWLEAHPELLAGGGSGDDTPAYLARLDAILAFDGRRYLGGIGAPTLVLGAEDDGLVPARHARQVAAGIAGSRLHLFPYGGHFPQTTITESYNRQLLEFLAASI